MALTQVCDFRLISKHNAESIAGLLGAHRFQHQALDSAAQPKVAPLYANTAPGLWQPASRERSS